MTEKTPLRTALSKSSILPQIGSFDAHPRYNYSPKQLSLRFQNKPYFNTQKYFLGSGRYLDWKVLDRAARLIAAVSIAPVRHGKSQVTAHVPEMPSKYNNVTEKTTMSSAPSRDLSSGTAVASVPHTMTSTPEYGGTSTVEHGESVGLRGRSHRSHRVAAAQQASPMIAQPDVKARGQVRAAGRDPHAPVLMEIVPAQSKEADQRGATLDLAKFAAPSGISYMNMISATHIGHAASLTRAVALSSPPWKGNTSAGSVPNVASGAGEGYEQGNPESYSGAGRAIGVGHMPAYAVQNWMQLGPQLAKAPSVEQAGGGLDWLKATRAEPAAPYNTRADIEAQWGKMSRVSRDYGMSFPSLPETRATDMQAGPIQDAVQNLPSDTSISAGFDAIGDTRQQILDEMTRLASRPPAGVTGFNAGQMPAWLSGWTGSV